MNIQNTDSYKYRKLIGQIKFSFIAPVVSRTFIDDSISATLNASLKLKLTGQMAQKEGFLIRR